MRVPPLLGLLLALAPPALLGPADAASLKADYLITLEGLTLGNAALEGSFEEARYDLKLSGQLTGLAGAFTAGARGAATARGALSGSHVVTAGYSASSQSASSGRTVQMGVAGTNVTSVAIEPPFEPLPNRVPLTDANKRGIIDPVSGLVALVANRAKPTEAANCNRTVPVFDGTQRFDIVLSYADTRLVRRPGYTGNVLVCAIRYVPIAGYRRDREAVRFMAENRDMSVWLAPVEGTRVLVPIRISVRTMIGTSVVEAQSWRVE